MGWLDKLFRKEESTVPGVVATIAPTAAGVPFAGLEGIRFGRYSDNNKSYTKNRSWLIAEERFKEKAYPEAFAALFDYISDEAEQNVVFRPDGRSFTFELVQGSKKVHGECDGSYITARASIAVMETPSNAVMRRLLDLNFSLRYTRCALDDKNTLCMIFDSTVPMASPNKLYYGLREIAKFADRQDDLLAADFASLKATDIDHIQPLPPAELEVKYNYFRKWIQDTLNNVAGLNPDSFAGAIAYCLLTLLYRIDFLIVPEARLMADLEAVSNMYWSRKDEVSLVERNAMMKGGIRKLLDITRDEFAQGVYRAKGTFSVVAVPPPDKIRENIQSANKDAVWYVDNNYPDLALVINEYGMVYNQFSYSMPKVLTDLTTIYMATVHAGYFRDLGMNLLFYNPDTKQFNNNLITAAIDNAVARWPDKYPSLKWDHGKISYSTLWDFAHTFSEQVAALNLELKK